MKIQYAANFVSSISYLPLVAGLAGGGNATAHTEQIENLIRDAQTSYRQRRYAEAIDRYKAAQSLIYVLLYPRHRIDYHLSSPAMMLPVGIATELKIAEASLKMAEVIKPDVSSPSYPEAAAGYVPPADQTVFEKIGFSDQSAVTPVTDKISLGVNLLSQGQAAQGIDVLNEAIANLGQATTPEARATQAAALLNLSSAQLLAATPQPAAATAAQAAELFAGLKDDIGRAQATEIRHTDTLTGRVDRQRMHYHRGYYDGLDREFRGFEHVEVETEGDTSTPSRARPDSFRTSITMPTEVRPTSISRVGRRRLTSMMNYVA